MTRFVEHRRVTAKGTQGLILGLPGPGHGAFNPYQSLLYEEMQALGWEVKNYCFQWTPQTCSVVHLHWPESKWNSPSLVRSLFRGELFLQECYYWKRAGCRIVWTAHNLESNDVRSSQLSRWFWHRMHQRCDGIIYLSQVGMSQQMAAHKGLLGKPYTIIEHGDYRNVLQPGASRKSARLIVGLKKISKVIGFF